MTMDLLYCTMLASIASPFFIMIAPVTLLLQVAVITETVRGTNAVIQAVHVKGVVTGQTSPNRPESVGATDSSSSRQVLATSRKMAKKGILATRKIVGQDFGSARLLPEDEESYAVALGEAEDSSRRPGVWAKALVDVKGDQEQAVLRYVELRVAQLREQKAVALQKAREDENAKQRREFHGDYALVERKGFLRQEWHADISNDVLTLRKNRDTWYTIPSETYTYDMEFGLFARNRMVVLLGKGELTLYGSTEDIAEIRRWWKSFQS